METTDPIITAYIATMVFVYGACIGSFLNVVIYRLPAGKSVVSPRSSCRCGKVIAWYDNIPILSWFILRGRCRHCKERFSIRYPLIELGTALLFLAVWDREQILLSLVLIVFISMLVPAAFIDLDTMEIPDRFSIGGFIIGVFLSVMIPALHLDDLSGIWFVDGVMSGVESLEGAFIGSGLILWLALVAEIVLKKEAMGFGDVKLMGAIGAFCGWQGAVFSLFGGAVIGCLIFGMSYPFLKGKSKEANDEEETGVRIPFGPALVAGAFLYIIFAHSITDAYFSDTWTLLESIRGNY